MPPKTRALQTWTRYWQRYSGELPNSLNQYNDKVAPATRKIITQVGKDGPVPKSMLGKLPPLAGTTAEASAEGGGLDALAIGRGAGRIVVIFPALGTLFLFVVFWVLYHGWKVTYGPIFEYLAKVGIDYDKLFVHIHIHPFSFLANIDRAVQNRLSGDLAFSERAFVWCVNQFLEPIILIVGTILAIGYALWYLGRATEHAIAHRIPRTINQTIVKPATKTITKTVTKTTATVRTIEHTVNTVRTRVLYVNKAALATVRRTAIRVGRIETRLKRDEHRLTRLEKRISVAGFAGLFFAMLAKTGLDWIRCQKVGRLGKAVCGMNRRHFDDLLGLLADFFFFANVCEVIPLLATAASEVGTPIVEGLTDVGAGLCAGYSGPAALIGPKASVPDLIFGISASGV